MLNVVNSHFPDGTPFILDIFTKIFSTNKTSNKTELFDISLQKLNKNISYNPKF